MRSFEGVIRRLKLSIHARIARKANAYLSNHKNACKWDKSANKLELRLPEKGWRLIDRIHIGTKEVPDQNYGFELDEELLERIDFFACLFGMRRIE